MVTRPFLILTLLIWCCLGNPAQLDSCEAKLGSGRYYQAFLKALNIGALTDDHLEKSAASDKPFHPLRHVTPQPVQTQAKHLFDTLVTDRSVIEHWPETRQALARLLEFRRSGRVIEEQASEATRKVLAPREFLELKNAGDQASPVTLDDGTPVLLHFAGRGQITVTGLGDRRPVKKIDVPEHVKTSEYRSLNWYRDLQGKLWIYIAATDLSVGPRVFKLAWGSRDWIPVELELHSNVSTRALFSPGPGVQLLRIATNSGQDTAYNIASGRAVEIQAQSGFGDGRFAYQAGGKVLGEPPRNSGLSRVYQTKDGIVRFLADRSFIAEWKGTQHRFSPVPAKARENDGLTFREFQDGRQLVALAHHLHGANSTIDVWNLGTFDRSLWSIPLPSRMIGSMRWLEDPRGDAILAVEIWGGPSPRLAFFNVSKKQALLTLDLSASIQDWFEIGGESYFTNEGASGGFSIQKIFNDPKGG